MGLADREYYQEEDHPGIRMGNRTMIVNLVIVNGVVFVANLLFGGMENRLAQFLALHASDAVQPWMWWRMLTFGFVHDPNVAGHILVNMFVLWMFGRDVEHRMGPRRLLRFYLIAVVLGGVLWSVRQWALGPGLDVPRLLMGASGAVTAVFMTYVLYFPTRTIYLFLVLPVPAWLVGVLYVITDVAGFQASSAGSLSGTAYDVHLVGAVFAFLYWHFNKRWGDNPTGWSSGRRRVRSGGFSWSRWNPFAKRRPTLRVHEPDVPASDVTAIDEQADAILQKVAEQGIDSLTPSERRILEAYSRRMKQKHR